MNFPNSRAALVRAADISRRAVPSAVARALVSAFVPAFAPGFVLAGAAAITMASFHPEAANAQPTLAADEQMVVTGQRIYPIVDTLAPDTEVAIDTAQLLKQLPGANLNANGALTGIAQYRGLYGDRVAVSIDGIGNVRGGPNAMDTPLSYTSPLLLQHLSLERGIASVSSAPESLGGHIRAGYDRGEHGQSESFAVNGKVQARHGANGGLNSTALRLVASNERHKFALLGQRDSAGDLDFPGGTLTPTQLNRERYDLSYAMRTDRVEALVYAGTLDTTDTGTPSLPMDIRYIETDLFGTRILADLGTTQLDIAIGHSDVEHVMDNHALRTPPATPQGYRQTLATGSGYNYRIGAVQQAGDGEWRFGVDGQTAAYEATITNPNAPAFRIDNFADVRRDIVGVYAQYNAARGRFDYEVGLRANRMSANSGIVTATIPAMNPMMEMMAMNAAQLASAFNGSDRGRSLTNVDAVLKVGRVLDDVSSVYVEVARKTRAPSYQEMYLWLPLESTGGLADGRSYIGNPDLKSEVSREINIGTNLSRGNVWFAPQVFYKDIANYIQGVPTSNATANAVAMMMTGAPALEFANTRARIHGVDLAWGAYLGQSFVLDGVLTAVRGRRTDVRDNLYRLAPANARLGLKYEADAWTAGVDVIGYARQRRTASYNDESPSAGYGVVDSFVHWRIQPQLRLSATVANLFDREYRDHVGGINRVAMTDVPLRERLPGAGRSFSVDVQYSW